MFAHPSYWRHASAIEIAASSRTATVAPAIIRRRNDVAPLGEEDIDRVRMAPRARPSGGRRWVAGSVVGAAEDPSSHGAPGGHGCATLPTPGRRAIVQLLFISSLGFGTRDPGEQEGRERGAGSARSTSVSKTVLPGLDTPRASRSTSSANAPVRTAPSESRSRSPTMSRVRRSPDTLRRRPGSHRSVARAARGVHGGVRRRREIR